MHEGPHEFETLYMDYKPECYLWEVYQMLQKVTLIGLLTFIERGSILQALIGLLVCSMLLMMMLNSKPYELSRTNTLAVFGQALIVVAYLSAVVLRVDLTGELFTVGMVGWAMIAANLPMAGYLIWDSYLTVRDELHHARIDLIRVELGRIGSHYRCVEERGVAVSRKREGLRRRAPKRTKQQARQAAASLRKGTASRQLLPTQCLQRKVMAKSK